MGGISDASAGERKGQKHKDRGKELSSGDREPYRNGGGFTLEKLRPGRGLVFEL
jgi:hypothetical protein